MEFICNGSALHWEPRRLVIAGYTGRDQASVRKHIAELEELGIPAPPRVPMLYDLSPRLLQTFERMPVVRDDGSGEAEVVLIELDGEWYVGLGSDHTDRVLEAVSIQKSKEVCAKPISTEIWPLASVLEHWDAIEMRSWVSKDGEERLYQSGTLGEFLHPNDLRELVRERGYASSGIAIFCGTLPLQEAFFFGGAFRAELSDPIAGRKLILRYDTYRLKDAEEE